MFVPRTLFYPAYMGYSPHFLSYPTTYIYALVRIHIRINI